MDPPNESEQVEISNRGLHWDALDEDISIDGLLMGFGDRTARSKELVTS